MCYYSTWLVTSKGHIITLAMLYVYTEVWRILLIGIMAKEM